MSNTLVQYLHAFAFPYLVWHSSAKQRIGLFVPDQKEFRQQAQSCRRTGRCRGNGPSCPAAADAPAAPRAGGREPTATEQPGLRLAHVIQEDRGRTCEPSRVSRRSSERQWELQGVVKPSAGVSHATCEHLRSLSSGRYPKQSTLPATVLVAGVMYFPGFPQLLSKPHKTREKFPSNFNSLSFPDSCSAAGLVPEAFAQALAADRSDFHSKLCVTLILATLKLKGNYSNIMTRVEPFTTNTKAHSV